MYYISRMPKLVVRRTGNSLALALPRSFVRVLSLAAGDELVVELERVPRILTFAGRLKGESPRTSSRRSATRARTLTDFFADSYALIALFEATIGTSGFFAARKS